MITKFSYLFISVTKDCPENAPYASSITTTPLDLFIISKISFFDQRLPVGLFG
jgi:hypothetical protein